MKIALGFPLLLAAALAVPASAQTPATSDLARISGSSSGGLTVFR